MLFFTFSDVYRKILDFKRLSDFTKKVQNIFGAVVHTPSAMFKNYSRIHNIGIALGFIKPSECHMAGEHIALLQLLCLKKNESRAMITLHQQDLAESSILEVPFLSCAMHCMRQCEGFDLLTSRNWLVVLLCPADKLNA